MTTAIDQPAMEPAAQPSLFKALPETARRSRKKVRAKPEVLVETAAPAESATAPLPPIVAEVVEQPLAVAAAALTNPELLDLITGLPDLRLSYLLVEAAREVRRRASPPAWLDDGEAAPAEPNASLLRAARLVVAELGESESSGL
ncbi:MAG: hypothetical protein GC191_02330 [Azospirillum sp.]|nr:hypothetical protein [Azospirillum sp.]